MNAKYARNVNGIWQRELGWCPRLCARQRSWLPSADISRLFLTDKLQRHTGCVNTVEWNDAGTLLISGSDDTKLGVWKYAAGWPLQELVHTGHSRNIFAAKFVPHSNDAQVVSCGLDGEVRLTHLDAARDHSVSTLLACNDDMLLTISFIPGMAPVFYTTQQDRTVRLFDLREPPPHASGGNARVVIKLGTSVYDLCFHPARPHLFALGSSHPLVQMFDMRAGPRETEPWASFAPKGWDRACESSSRMEGVSGVDLSPKGELLANYRGGHVYMFDTTLAAGAGATEVCETVAQCYAGRRNQDTFLKQVKFLFHSKQEFVATGGDCGCLYIWHKASGRLLRRIHADSFTVNAVAPHPYLPLLATSGIDSDIKVWECTAPESVDLLTSQEPDRQRHSTRHRAGAESQGIQETGAGSESQNPQEGPGEPITATGSDSDGSTDLAAVELVGEAGDVEDVGSLRTAHVGAAQRCLLHRASLRRGQARMWRGAEVRLDVVTVPEAEGRLVEARGARDAGNRHFREKQMEAAQEQYSRALQLLEFHPPSRATDIAHTEATALCLLNLAACHLHLCQPQEVAMECTLVLCLQPSNVKALLRLTQAQIELEDWTAAENSLARVTNICGTQDVDVRRLGRKLSQLKGAQARKEQRCYQAMFPSS